MLTWVCWVLIHSERKHRFPPRLTAKAGQNKDELVLGVTLVQAIWRVIPKVLKSEQ
jgi:hypothetical protein